MPNGGVPLWVKIWLVVLTVVALWVVWWASRASNWSERAVRAVESRVDVLSTNYEHHTHTVVSGNQTLQTSPAGPVSWPVEGWPPETLKFP
jgi:hypothetical protein